MSISIWDMIDLLDVLFAVGVALTAFLLGSAAAFWFVSVMDRRQEREEAEDAGSR